MYICTYVLCTSVYTMGFSEGVSNQIEITIIFGFTAAANELLTILYIYINIL